MLDANVLQGQPLGPVIPNYVKVLNFRAQAKDLQSLGSQNAGVYQIGYQIYNADTGQLATNRNGNVLDFFSPPNGPKQTYDSIPVNLLMVPGDAYDTTVSHGGAPGETPAFQYFYFANNAKDSIAPFDVTSLNGGNYNVCVLVKDIKGNGGDVANQRGAACSRFPTEGPSFLVGVQLRGISQIWPLRGRSFSLRISRGPFYSNFTSDST